MFTTLHLQWKSAASMWLLHRRLPNPGGSLLILCPLCVFIDMDWCIWFALESNSHQLQANKHLLVFCQWETWMLLSKLCLILRSSCVRVSFFIEFSTWITDYLYGYGWPKLTSRTFPFILCPLVGILLPFWPDRTLELRWHNVHDSFLGIIYFLCSQALSENS